MTRRRPVRDRGRISGSVAMSRSVTDDRPTRWCSSGTTTAMRSRKSGTSSNSGVLAGGGPRIPRSKLPSSTPATTSPVVPSSRMKRTPGYWSRKRASRSGSQWAPTVWRNPRWTSPVSADTVPAASATASRISPRMRSARPTKRRPALVSRIERPIRSKRGTPTSCSRRAIFRLTVDWSFWSASAARPRCSRRATSIKVRKRSALMRSMHQSDTSVAVDVNDRSG